MTRPTLTRLRQITGLQWQPSMGDYQAEVESGVRLVLYWDQLGGYWVAYLRRADGSESQSCYGYEGGSVDGWERAVLELGKREELWP